MLSIYNLFWLVLIIAFALIEAITVGLVCIWFALGSLAGLLISCVTDNFFLQIAGFCVGTFLTLYFTRPLVKKYLQAKIVPTNAKRNIGRTGTVIVAITPEQPGRVRLDGVDWIAACAQPLEAGSLCTVDSIESTTLTVIPLVTASAAPQV